MAARNRKQCELAQKYFYDMMDVDTAVQVPREVLEHIAHCPKCVKELARFMSESWTLRRNDVPRGLQMTAQVEKHFAMLGKLVDCRTTRKFLPALADPGMKINMPTPITVHMEQCEQCEGTLSRLYMLNLNSKQFTRLSEVYSRFGSDDRSICQAAQNSMRMIAEMRYNQVLPEILSHVGICPDCRKLLYQAREKVIEEAARLPKPTGDDLCEEFSDCDFFDYSVPSNEPSARNRGVILDHFRTCPKCLARIQSLHSTLYDMVEQEESGVVSCYELALMDGGITDIDKLRVDCQMAKRFLTEFVEDETQIMVAKPITEHINRCTPCMADLETIRAMNLGDKQLAALELVLGLSPDNKNHVMCSKAQAVIDSVAAMDFSKASAAILRHICICPKCRELLYEQRERMIEQLTRVEKYEKKFPCRKVEASDIFDYCFPYGIDPANDQYVKFRPSFTNHVSTCPDCLAKMQKLHAVIRDIFDRKNSGVVTRYEPPAATKGGGFVEVKGQYDMWPIRVWVRRPDGSAPKVKTPKEPKRADLAAFIRVLTLLSKPKLLAIVMMILMAAGLLFYLRPAVAVTLNTVYAAVEKITNVCLSRFTIDKPEQVQQVWVSQKYGLRLTSDGKSFVLCDTINGTKKSKPADSGITEITPLTAEDAAQTKNSIVGTLGFMPFPAITDVPKDAPWQRITDKDIEAVVPGTEVYELTWSEGDGVNIRYRKWRAFIDTSTNLPKRAEWYLKTKPEEEYKLKYFVTADYPTDDEIQALIKDKFD